ncbi:FtsK/SpoIIIE family DNA translocase [Leptospira kirschneri]|uniref:FtsK/SpoIIIE family DNA translocase n=1 Tax=Leptospira kirschneri TaxID=29507 RepID=UPI0002784C2C|nr:DNA translocase FtsK [Leptospira kirschneri]EJO71430.1 putative stage III sporulation protein E [Leptospira kirschneri serovar Grippotyphosa str. RM52]EKQ82323.1 putative stage III sporulation protein E [Leptospira kirschneri serovar Grippotyphosa str. Moskva]EKR10240.1 putative stage III sporulation protein E [Leptospira kirschneri serovar Valbuzzi str. 200702274]EMK07444.1 putative stage III sporulation protein E [Leptospira kirschneri str. MMD1493]OOV49292.1 DNA translocase FtsK [Leptosp
MESKSKEFKSAWNLQNGKMILPYLLLFAGIILTLSLGSFDSGEHGVEYNFFGRLGYYISYGMFFMFGAASFLPGLFTIGLGSLRLVKEGFELTNRLFSIPVFLLCYTVTLQVTGHVSTIPFASQGGFVGQLLSSGLEFVFGSTGKILIHLVFYFYGLILLLNESPLHFIGRAIGTAGAKYKEGFKSGFGKRGENLGSLFQSAVEKFQRKESAPPWISTNTNDWNDLQTKSLGNHRSSELQNTLHSTFGKEGKLSDFLSKVDTGPTVTSKNSRIRFQNHGAFSGNFEKQGKVFRFESVSSSLSEKIREEKNFQKATSRWEIIDFRTSSFSNISSEKEPSITLVAPSESEIKKEWNQTNLILQSEKSQDKFSFEEKERIEQTDSELEKEFYEEESVDSEEDFSEEETLSSETSIEKDISENLKTSTISSSKEVSTKHTSSSPEEEKLEPGLPFPPTTLVPEVKSKRSIYHVPLKSLKTTTTKIQDPLFKIEADKVARKIEEIIRQYGYESQVVSMERGPIITRYELTPPLGVKLGRITSLSDELRLYLAVKNIRIVAPIPGKSTIGIEVPNSIREDVFLGDILHQNLSLRPKKDLSILIGKDISGKLVGIDLNKLPHLLVAGTTGSGKSVCLNSMISSLVVHLSPEEVRFIMIDPKMVELTLYEDIPHLLMPVITDPKKATRALAWAIQEMEARYHSVSKLKCRDFKTYNEKVEQGAHRDGYKKMPYIVIFIDELADLMMVSGKDLEDAITRITQKSRAVGIHLIMATQRPSVDVITGLIKANCPARMAFHVAQKTDSKIILDQNGAESLLGKGDFLYKSPTAADLIRIQSPYVSEEEIEKIVEEARKFGKPSYVDFDLDEETENSVVDEGDEELFEQAWEIVRTDRKASASYLQRRMRIGYNKAARLMELMEERGYVSPQIGSKGREILK